MRFGEPAQAIHVAWTSGKMHRQNGSGSRSDAAGDIVWVEIHSDRIDISHYGVGAGMYDGVDSRTESESARNDLVTWLESGSDQTKMQRRGTGIDGRNPIRIHMFVPGKTMLKFLNTRPGSYPTGFQGGDNLCDFSGVDVGGAECQKRFTHLLNNAGK